MEQGRASRTAQGAAFFRAIESTFPEGKRVCCDPYARVFLSHGVDLAGKYQWAAKRWKSYLEKKGLGPQYGEVVTRTRYIDDHLADRMGAGVSQVVLLGAGYDTRAHRCAALAGSMVFELDHPDTQRVKRQRIARADVSPRSDLTYVPIDFDTEDISERLRACGYDRGRKTLFIWEGVTMYLTGDRVDTTLAFVADGSPRGSSIVFNYVYRSSVEGVPQNEAIRQFRERLERMGEPITYGINEDELEGFMSGRGFTAIEHAPCAQIGKTYFDAAGREQLIARTIGIATAEVA
jgi:methyltransferase (TIGR00027 family)